MTEFETILEANSKPARTKRKLAPLDEKSSLFLDKVREVKRSLQREEKTLVVVDKVRELDEIFLHYAPTMKLLSKSGLLYVKTVDRVSEDDLEMNIIEID